VPLAVAFVAVALAHPGARGAGGGPARLAIGHRSVVVIDGDTATLDYVCEVPAITLYGEARREGATSGYVETKLDELASGLHLTWDGAPLALEPVAVAEPAREGEQGFIDLRVTRRATLPGDTGTLALRNGNYPDTDAYFATEVRLSGDVVATKSSLARVQDGRLRDNRHGAWQREESGREPSVAVRPARWYERADGLFPMTERMEGLLQPTLPARIALAAAGILGLFALAKLGRALGTRARALRALPEPEARSPKPPPEGQP
jgi:hypothetical protein